MRLLHIAGLLFLAATSACYSPGALCSDVIDPDPEITKITCTSDSQCKYPGAEESQVPCYYCPPAGAGARKCAVVPGPFRCRRFETDPNAVEGVDDVCPDGYCCATLPGKGDWCINDPAICFP